MKTLVNLQADTVDREGGFNELRHCVHHSPAKNITCQLALGKDSLVISRGQVVVAIPIPELMALAAKSEPLLTAQPAKVLTPSSQPKKN